MSNSALEVLREVFGFDSFRGHQQEVINHVIDGGSALVLMPTGGGKSLCYQIPALVRSGTAIVVSPLIALMQDQVNSLNQLGIKAAFLNSSQDWQSARLIERQFLDAELDLLYIAPERLLTDRTLSLLKQGNVALFAIDEAHCVSQWGHDFRPEYLGLSVLHQYWPNVPRLALTATATTATQAEIAERLALTEAPRFVASFDRPNIRYRIVEKNNVRAQLLEFIKREHIAQSGIVYCLSRNRAEDTAAFLSKNGIYALPYHAGLSAQVRAANQQIFIKNKSAVMVATIAFGMGIDKPDIRFVAHIDMPKSIEGYYQETGRAGRDGKPANAWLAYGLNDVMQLMRFISNTPANEVVRRRMTDQLDAMLALCENVQCRRQRLLAYFDQEISACGNCDTCLSPPKSWDGTIAAQKVLSTVYRLWHECGQQFGAVHVIDILRGKSTERVRQHGHASLSVFGVGADLSEKAWRAVLRQLLAKNFLGINHEQYNTLFLTESSRSVLRGEITLMLRAPTD